MPERNAPVQRILQLILVFELCGFVLVATPIGSALWQSHLAARQRSITPWSLVHTGILAVRQESRRIEGIQQKEKMGHTQHMEAPSGGQIAGVAICGTPINREGDLRIFLVMSAIQQRRMSREYATPEDSSVVRTEQSFTPPNTARWALLHQRSWVC